MPVRLGGYVIQDEEFWPKFWDMFQRLLAARLIVIEFRDYPVNGYTQHSFRANATSLDVGSSEIKIVYDHDKTVAAWREAREEDEREAGGDG